MGKGKSKWYAVRKGYTTGIFTDWASCEAATKGFSGAEFKSFGTQAEAEAFLAAAGGAAGARPQGGPSKSSMGAGAGAAYSLTGSKRPYSAIVSSKPPPPAFNSAIPAAAGVSGPGQAGVPGQQQQQQQRQGELQVNIFFDGGSRGNPGRAGYGYVIYDRATGVQLRMGCRPLPYGSTNNEAEYTGMVAGLHYAVVLGARHVVVRGDSELIVKQMNGVNRVASPKLLPLYREAKMLADEFDSFEIQHVYREDNAVADKLSNIAMDTDQMVYNIGKGLAGNTRRQVALAFIGALDVGGNPEYIHQLCTAPSFTQAAAVYLARIWDSMDIDDVLMELGKQGWTDETGGPPEPGHFPGPAAPAPAASAASASTALIGNIHRDPPSAPAGRVGRGQQTVAVAALRLGQGWATEIRKQEELQQQGQGQQQRRPLSYGEQMLDQPGRQQQQQQQRRGQVAGGSGTGVAGFDMQCGGQAPVWPSQQQQQHQQQQLGKQAAGGSSGARGAGFDRSGGQGAPVWPPPQQQQQQSGHGAAGWSHSGNGINRRNNSSSSGRDGAPAAFPKFGSAGQYLPALAVPVQPLRQEQVGGQHFRALYSQSSSRVADLQPRPLNRHISVQPFASRAASSSSSSSRVDEGASRMWPTRPVRCCCAGAGSRDMCLLHSAFRVAGGPRLRAAAGVVAITAAAASSVRHRQHPRMRCM